MESNRDSLPSDSDNATPKSVATVSVPVPSKKGPKFWLVFASMCICLFLSALELSSISTALPTIAHDLHASQFVWVGSAYALSSTAFLPMSGGLAQAFGRRPAILLTISFFAFGSAICGSASSMNMLIAGRTVQGLGGGGIQSLTGIILADLVTLQERGVYAGLYGLTWCLAAAVGPVIGGSLAARGQWRWLFYLNLPISLIACLSVILFLDLPTPHGDYREKLGRMDWIGNLLIIASTVACTIALTWGGVTVPWGSPTVLVPLILGLLGLVAFIVYEATLATDPLVPLTLMTNITSLSGYVQTFCIGFNTFAIVYFFPVYFQACQGASPVLSGTYNLSLCTFTPGAILAGLSVKVMNRYRPQMWAAWLILVVTMGLLCASTHGTVDMGVGIALGYLALLGFGMGALSATTMYPIQAPLSVTQNAPALAWMWFLRSFAGVWGITVGSTVVQNVLSSTLSPSLSASLPRVSEAGVPSLYALIPELPTLPAPVRAGVQTAFARALAVLWVVLVGVCVVGGVASGMMRAVPLSGALDPSWAMKQRGEGSTEETDVDETPAVVEEKKGVEEERYEVAGVS